MGIENFSRQTILKISLDYTCTNCKFRLDGLLFPLLFVFINTGNKYYLFLVITIIIPRVLSFLYISTYICLRQTYICMTTIIEIQARYNSNEISKCFA